MHVGIDYSEVGRRIRAARKERNMTQEELSVACGCSENHLSAIETGKNKPSLELVFAIATVLECSMDSLFADYRQSSSSYVIDTLIVPKLEKCTSQDLMHINKVIDETLEYRDNILATTKV